MQLTTGIDWEGNEIGGSGGSEKYRRTNSRDGFRTQISPVSLVDTGLQFL